MNINTFSHPSPFLFTLGSVTQLLGFPTSNLKTVEFSLCQMLKINTFSRPSPFLFTLGSVSHLLGFPASKLNTVRFSLCQLPPVETSILVPAKQTRVVTAPVVHQEVAPLLGVFWSVWKVLTVLSVPGVLLTDSVCLLVISLPFYQSLIL